MEDLLSTCADRLTTFADESAHACWASAPNNKSCIPLDRYWQRPAETHVVEFAVINGIALLAGIVGWRMLQRRALPVRSGDYAGYKRPTSPPLRMVIAAVLQVCFVAQTWYKLQRNDGVITLQPLLNLLGLQDAGILEAGWELPRGLVWMAMPCHAYTLLAMGALLSYNDVVVLQGSDAERGAQEAKANRVSNLLASLCVTFSWNTFLGSAFFDFSDQVHWTEPYTFVLHHGLLNVLSMYFARYFTIEPYTLAWMLWSSSLMTLFNMAYEVPLSYLSGYNVNYHIHPPTKGLPHKVFGPDPHYKPKIILILVLLSTSSLLILRVVSRLLNWAVPVASAVSQQTTRESVDIVRRRLKKTN